MWNLRVPPNVRFEIDDAESDWTFSPNSFDFIHARTLTGSISDWDTFLKRIYTHLKPGGWVELVENEAWAKSDDGSLTKTSAIYEWQSVMDEATTKIGKKMNIADTLADKMTAAGFVDVQDDIYKVRPVSPP
jgi:trans-aconitate methyltransferase